MILWNNLSRYWQASDVAAHVNDTERSYSPFDMFMFANNVSKSEAIDLAVEQGDEDPEREILFDGVPSSVEIESPREETKKASLRVRTNE